MSPFQIIKANVDRIFNAWVALRDSTMSSDEVNAIQQELITIANQMEAKVNPPPPSA